MADYHGTSFPYHLLRLPVVDAGAPRLARLKRSCRRQVLRQCGCRAVQRNLFMV